MLAASGSALITMQNVSIDGQENRAGEHACLSRQPTLARPAASRAKIEESKMRISPHDLRSLAERVEKLGASGYQADPVTADLLWSAAGRLRYRASQMEDSIEDPPEDLPEEAEPRKRPRFTTGLGSALRTKVRRLEAAPE